MSKIGKKNITIPKDSSVKSENGLVIVTGPKGSKTLSVSDKIFSMTINENNEFNIKPLAKDLDTKTSVMWGTHRSLINNAVLGVSKGHEKILELKGVGFRATLKGEILAKRAVEKKITNVYFDRGSYKYHGRIKMFADSLRKNGLEF